MEIDNIKITFLIDREETRIELYDYDACITFLKLTLTPAQLSSALARMAFTDVESAEFYGLNKLGKKRVQKDFEFKIPPEFYDEWRDPKYKENLSDYSQKLLDEEGDGWISGRYFDSQNSFFWKNDEKWARCLVIKWIEK